MKEKGRRTKDGDTREEEAEAWKEKRGEREKVTNGKGRDKALGSEDNMLQLGGI